MPNIARKQWINIPTPIPNAHNKPPLLLLSETSLIIIAVSGPGLITANKWAKAA